MYESSSRAIRRPEHLGRVARNQLQERPRPRGEALSRDQPRLQKALLLSEDESALARLEIEQQPLELVRGREYRLRVSRPMLRRAQFGDRE
jgi:hypothetical protein